ncbi:MAG: asparagine synthase (glutamine-hydrolyzing) [Alphaproteobacteria bacterium]|nr:asparagine synthase (glutamine-hydrolyzing) [Alphaproteobacteria bacterium]
MCGIAGLFLKEPAPAAPLARRVRAMADAIAHRGPDDAGVWVDDAAGLAFGHRRLAIIDLSPAGHQPMLSADGRYVICYNGELYNYRELAAELAALGRIVAGRSDTAVLLEAVAAWGVAGALPRFNGMFAFALWDRAERVLWLARDHVGIKPLYWAELPGMVLFGSELKALIAAGGWRPEIDPAAAAAFLRFGYVPGPHCIYRGVRKLQAGAYARIPLAGPAGTATWFDLPALAREGQGAPAALSPGAAAEELGALLSDAVRRQLVADVPVGAFLSGGIDSTTVAALMRAAAGSAARSFTIGFEEGEYDESRHAAAVARHLGLDHTTLTARPEDALALIPGLPATYDEPFADSSQLPTMLLSRLTRGHVTVALSGDGGDELFGGYNRYLLAERLWRRLAAVPRPLRAAAAQAISTVPVGWWDAAAGVLPARLRPPQTGDKLHKLAGILSADGIGAVYPRLVSQWPDAARHIAAHEAPPALVDDASAFADLPSPLARMQLLDTLTYLPDDILTKVDRASMAVALEVRVPLLDPRVIAFAWRLPRALLIRPGKGGAEGKAVLRDLLDRHVPRALMERPKQGFGVPIAAWLRGPLRDWAEDLLAAPNLDALGLVQTGAVRAAWAEHLGGRRNWQYGLWTVLMLAAWARAREQARPPVPAAA